MIDIPVHDIQGKQIDTLQVDEQSLGGEVRPALLKQAYVCFHANRRQGSAHTKNRSEVSGSTRKLYRQKGTGNARRGPSGTNLMRGGGHAHSKKPHSWRQRMPKKMRQLANRNALLAKAVDGEIRLLDHLEFDKPSTGQFAKILSELKIDRTCLLALANTTDHAGRSARNLEHITITRVDQLNVFDILNHRYLVADKTTFAGWLENSRTDSNSNGEGA